MAEPTGKGKGKLIGLIVAAVVVVGALVVCFVIKPPFLPWVGEEEADVAAAPAGEAVAPVADAAAPAPEADALVPPVPGEEAAPPEGPTDDATAPPEGALAPVEPAVAGELVRLEKRHPGREFIPLSSDPVSTDWSDVRYIVDSAGGMYVRSSAGFLFEVDDGNIISDPF